MMASTKRWRTGSVPVGVFKTPEIYEAEAKWVKGCLLHSARHAARKIWQRRHNKVLPPTIEVCHTCDNPKCILDAHHFVGTHADNMNDAVSKGRHPGQRTRSINEKLRSRNIALKLWDNSEYAVAVSAGVKSAWANSDRHRKSNKPRRSLFDASIENWQSATYRSKILKSLESTNSKPEVKRRRSKGASRMWADGTKRANLIDGMRQSSNYDTDKRRKAAYKGWEHRHANESA